MVAAVQGNYEAARVEFETGLRIRRKLDDKPGMGFLFNNLGAVALQFGDFAAAQAFNEKGLVIQHQLNDHLRIALLLNNLGEVAMLQGEYIAAQTHIRRSSQITPRYWGYL